MQDIIDNLPRTNGSEHIPLFDTCFVINLFEKSSHPKIDFPFAMTSFNAEELLHNFHKIPPHAKDNIRHFFKNAASDGNKMISILDIPVHPGQWKAEEEFVGRVDSMLLHDIPDTSDAVLIAAAIMTHSDVFTKDRHHLYTAILGNYLQNHNIHVWKELKDKQ